MSNFGDILEERYVRKFRANAEIRKKKLAALKTKADVYAYIEEIKKKLAAAYDFPKTKCPLNVRCVEKVKRSGYTVEKLIYFSRPDYPVTATLYVPDGAKKGKTPAVMQMIGHAIDGKAYEGYQAVGITLCRKGCMVLMADPIGQAERRSFADNPQYQNTREHNLMNRRLQPMGDCTGAWRAWDGIRGVDLLLSRPETDPRRVGITGNSGGGTMTTIVNAVDPRLVAAAPNCYITTWLRLVENELPVDAEQIPAGLAADGGEMSDLLIVRAPNPVLIMGEKEDFFDPRGTKEVYEELKRIYTILGVPERVRFFCGTEHHGYNPEARKAAYGFFNDFFQLGKDDSEPAPGAVKEEELYCSPNGRVFDLPGMKKPDFFIRKRAAEIVSSRKKLAPAQLKSKLRALLNIPAQISCPTYRVLRVKYYQEREVYVNRFGVETEPGLPLTLFWFNKEDKGGVHPGDKVELYLPDLDSVEELKERALMSNKELLAFDWRGIGESLPEGCDQGAWARGFSGLYGFDYFFDSISKLLGESYVADRVLDVLKVLVLLKENGVKEITLSASGKGMELAVFAAVLSKVPVKTDFAGRCPTYLQSVLSPIEQLPQSLIPFNILSLTDMDELQELAENCGK